MWSGDLAFFYARVPERNDPLRLSIVIAHSCIGTSPVQERYKNIVHLSRLPICLCRPLAVLKTFTQVGDAVRPEPPILATPQVSLASTSLIQVRSEAIPLTKSVLRH